VWWTWSVDLGLLGKKVWLYHRVCGHVEVAPVAASPVFLPAFIDNNVY